MKRKTTAKPAAKKAAKTGTPFKIYQSDAAVSFTLSVKAEGLEPILGAAYLMTDRAYARLTGDRRNKITVELRPKAQNMIVIQHNLDTLDRTVPPWLEVDGGSRTKVTVRDLPMREHIDVPVREQLIVELYSK